MLKKHYIFVLIALMLSFPFSLWASVGQILLVTGDVNILRAEQSLKAQSGATLLEKDKVVTQAGARAQLRFTDDTVITLGSNTDFSIEAFLDENTVKAKAEFGVTKGTFKAITGRIGKIAPENFTLKTNNATIGIRGTIFSGNIQARREIIAALRGQIRVRDSALGAFVDVGAGQVTYIVPGQAPESPRSLNPNDLDELNPDRIGEGGRNQQNDVINDEEDSAIPSNQSIIQDEANASPSFNQPDTSEALNNKLDDQLSNKIQKPAVLNLTGWRPFDEEATAFSVSASTLVGSFENSIGWGVWETGFDPHTGHAYTDYWVGGTEASAAADYIQSLSSGSGGTYTYTGKVMGEVWLYSEMTSVAINSAGSSVSLTADFNSLPTISGTMQFNTGIGSPDWIMSIDSSDIAGGVFSTGLSGGGVSGYIDGQFYGSQANSVGGVFNAYDDSMNSASGVFKAAR